MVFSEYSWTPGEMVQAEDRAHRIGQTQSVNVHYLHVKRSIDDVMWQSLAAKLDNVGQARAGRMAPRNSDAFGDPEFQKFKMFPNLCKQRVSSLRGLRAGEARRGAERRQGYTP